MGRNGTSLEQSLFLLDPLGPIRINGKGSRANRLALLLLAVCGGLDMLFPLGSLFLFLLLAVWVWRIVEPIVQDRAGLVERYRANCSRHHEKVDCFLDTMTITWYQIVVIFVSGSFIGLVIEQVWMFITAGLTESRCGLVWGPFSPLYGFGSVLLTLICFEMRRRSAAWWQVIIVSMIVGGMLEQFTGWSMETLMGATSWDYSHVPGCISKWVAWPFLFFWGLLGLCWAKGVMPEMLYRIGVPTRRRQVTFVSFIAVYMAFDIFMTLACFGRVVARENGVPPHGAFERWVDENYSDEFVANRFENMVFEKDGND